MQLPNGLDWRLGTDDLYLNDSVYNSIQPARGVVWHLKVDAEGIPTRDSSGRTAAQVSLAGQGGCVAHEGGVHTACCSASGCTGDLSLLTVLRLSQPAHPLLPWPMLLNCLEV